MVKLSGSLITTDWCFTDSGIKVTLDAYLGWHNRTDRDRPRFMDAPPREPAIIAEECRGLKTSPALALSLGRSATPSSEFCDGLLRSTFMRVRQPPADYLENYGLDE